MVSIIWNPKFGGKGIIYQYILKIHDTFEHGGVLGRSNLKNRLRYSESEEEVFKKLTKKYHKEEGVQPKK